MSGRPKPGRDDAAEQLRELIREAHSAAKDLRAAIREVRAVADEASAAVNAKVNQDLTDWCDHWQTEMNRHATDLNAAVDHARGEILKQLTLASIERSDDGTLRFKFAAGHFKEDGEVTRR
jgi:hypothetical protein